MRDFHKVQEQEGFALTLQQVYLVAAALVVVLGIAFAAGYNLGKGTVPTPTPAEDPLIPPDVQNESVAQLLARAAEEEADPANQEKLELQFHSILPNRTGEQSEAPPPGAAAHATDAKAADPKAGAKDGAKPASGTETTAQGANSADAKASASASDGDGKNSGKAGDATGSGAGARSAASSSTGEKSDSKSADSGKGQASGKDSSKAAAGGSTGDAARSSTSKDAAKSSEPQMAAKPSKPAVDSEATSGAGKGFTVQVSSYQEAGVADKLVRQLMAQGFSAYRVEADVNGQKWYRVRVGSFESQDKAEKEMQRLKAARSELKPMIAHK